MNKRCREICENSDENIEITFLNGYKESRPMVRGQWYDFGPGP